MGEGFEARYYPFHQKPLSDTCWSLSNGPDHRVYAAACTEHTGGQSVAVMRYDRAVDDFRMVFDLADVCDDKPDSGRATQCKIHYGFAPSPATGLLYCATHLSGPPLGETYYCPWSGWHDPRRAFRGSMLVAYDTRRDAVAWSTLMIPREGCRCLALDESRNRLYAVTYPRDHFVAFDLDTRTLTDHGRIGSVNSQCLIPDGRGRIVFTDDRGRFLRFDPDARDGKGRLEALPWVYPSPAEKGSWHGVIYDAAPDAAGESVFLIPWAPWPRLARFWPRDGVDGRLEDWGPLTPPGAEALGRDFPLSFSLTHAGGLVTGTDRALYFVRASMPARIGEPRAWADRSSAWFAASRGEVMRIDEKTRSLEKVGELPLAPGMTSSNYVSRGARDATGDLFFGHVSAKPTGAFRVRLPGSDNAAGATGAAFPLRLWG